MTTNNAIQAAPATEVPKGFWPDAKGNLIRVDKIKDVDKERDKVVRDMIEQAKQLSGVLASFKLDAMAQVAEFAQASADKYGAKLGGVKGNITLTSFDGKYKVVRQNSDTLAFDERLQAAQALIGSCIQSWSKGANKNLQAVVAQAFETDADGKVSVGRILGLRRMKVEDDPRWDEAMQAIADGIRVVSSKSYLRFYERDDATGEYKPINLDVAVL